MSPGGVSPLMWLLLAGALLLSGCGLGFCVKLQGSYAGISGSVKFCADRPADAGAPPELTRQAAADGLPN